MSASEPHNPRPPAVSRWSNVSSAIHRACHAVAVLVAFSLLQGGSCGKGGARALPSTSSKEYADTVRSFFVGLAALQAGDFKRATEELTKATRLAPGEPAALANLAILELRGQRTDAALKTLQEARDIAPDDSRIIYLHAIAKAQRGDFAGATADYKLVAQKDPSNLRARYALVEQVQQSGGPDADVETKRLLQEMAAAKPDNIIVQLDLARLAIKQGDAESLKGAVARLSTMSAPWPANVKQHLSKLQTAANSGNARAGTTPVLYLKNLLMAQPKYRADTAALKAPVGEMGVPITQFVKLQNPPLAIAAPDEGITFAAEPQSVGTGAARYASFLYPDNKAKPSLLSLSVGGVSVAGFKASIPFPGGSTTGSLNSHPVAAADLNSDFRMDLVLAGAGGLKIHQQGEGGSFADVTAKAKLPPPLAAGKLGGVWAADVELDGDLDLIVAPESGSTVVLQNNADGTYKPILPFAAAASVVDFGWADLDDDSDADAVLLDAHGVLHVFTNERAGQFKHTSQPAGVSGIVAIAVLDSDEDGQFDVVGLKQDGTLTRIIRDLTSGAQDRWKSAELGRWDGRSGLKAGSARIFASDLDNNGAIDLIASSGSESRIWLHGPGVAYKPLAAPLAAQVVSATDMNGDGRNDLIGFGADGKPVILTNQCKKSYGWQEVRPQATKSTGDQRMNSFCIGGSIEFRSGFLSQRMIIQTPVVHVGLGETGAVDAARIYWPHGQMQGEFAPQPNQTVSIEQRLTGSCPWMFAWDGTKMAFVTDALWRSPLGLRINAVDTGPVAMTADWLRIPGSRLAPRDGAYDIRITAELWETHFFDHVSLMAVDHPIGTEVWVDERFAIPPPKVGYIVTKPSVPVERATDDNGTDVTSTVRDLDARYLDTFGRGYYQGVTRDHFVEVELGPNAPDSGPLWLIGQGWIHPTDSSINVALAQSSRPQPRDLSLEIPDGKGGWKVAKPHLGFPAGKTKSILIDLTGLFQPGQPKRLRLRTNLEIYWDRLSWAAGADSTASGATKTQRWLPKSADLKFRGYSTTSQADASSPELPDYEDLASTSPRWCDLVGYHTRFGDVRELLGKVDDRYVIMNAGDEMVVRFTVPPPPPVGLTRDFVLISDGWEKDGNLNTGFSKTVLPLPSHANPFYSTPPSTLENDPVYKRHSGDWLTYHTRYVTPDAYWSAFRTKATQ